MPGAAADVDVEGFDGAGRWALSSASTRIPELLAQRLADFEEQAEPVLAHRQLGLAGGGGERHRLRLVGRPAAQLAIELQLGLLVAGLGLMSARLASNTASSIRRSVSGGMAGLRAISRRDAVGGGGRSRVVGDGAASGEEQQEGDGWSEAVHSGKSSVEELKQAMESGCAEHL